MTCFAQTARDELLSRSCTASQPSVIRTTSSTAKTLNWVQVECAEKTRTAYNSAQEALRAKQQASAGVDGQPSSQHAQEGRWPLHGGDLPVFGIPGIHISLPTAVGPVSFSPLFLSKEQLDRTWVSCPRFPSPQLHCR